MNQTKENPAVEAVCDHCGIEIDNKADHDSVDEYGVCTTCQLPQRVDDLVYNADILAVWKDLYFSTAGLDGAITPEHSGLDVLGVMRRQISELAHTGDDEDRAEIERAMSRIDR